MLPAYILAHHMPPPAPPLTLTVNARGCVYPSKALLHKLNLRAGQPMDVLPPSADCSHWQLDLRPTAGHRIGWYAGASPRLRGLKLPPGLVQPGTRLTLALAPTLPTGPACYPLLPIS